ncbi:MAG: hypothetical protein MUF61_01230 [archaeon]|nr:hypothetical protein [archaeon]
MWIKELRGAKILDSRGHPTIGVEVNGCRASSPEGKSKGKHETKPYCESLDWSIHLIDVLKIPYEINSFDDLIKVENLIKDQFGFKNVHQFGANALFALESAILKALAKEQKKELWQIINPKARKFPIPVGNAIGGGLHSENFVIHPTFQEFLLIPQEKSFEKNVKMMNSIYTKIGKLLHAEEKNDEGAWQLAMDNTQVLDILSEFAKDARIGLDVASSSFYKYGFYLSGEKTLNKEEHIEYINNLIKKYNLFYVEDPVQEEDFDGFRKINKEKTLVVGDDLTVTHFDRVKGAIKDKAINAMIIKPNQNGSLLDVRRIFELCKKNKIKTVLSHRSGETMDSAIADYAFGFGADYFKCGISTPWREAKLNRMIEIERSLK